MDDIKHVVVVSIKNNVVTMEKTQKQLAELKTLLADYETTIIKQQKQLESFKLVSTSTSS